MLPTHATMSHLRSSSRDTTSTTSSRALRQRLSRSLKRPLSSATSSSSLSSRSISTKSIKFKTSSSIWASMSAKAQRVFTRNSSLRTLESGLIRSPTLATIAEHDVFEGVPPSASTSALTSSLSTPTRLVLAVDYERPSSQFFMPRATGVVEQQEEPADAAPKVPGVRIITPSDSSYSLSGRRLRAKDDSTVTVHSEKLTLLPLKALKPRPQVKKPVSPRLTLETQRTFKVVKLTDTPNQSSSLVPPSGVKTHSQAPSKNFRPPLPSELQRSRAQKRVRVPSVTAPAKEASASSSVNRLTVPTDTSTTKPKEQRRSQKPLPRLPRAQRQRISLKPPSFIPLSTPLDPMLSIPESSEMEYPRVQESDPKRGPRFVRASMKPPSFIPLNIEAVAQEEESEKGLDGGNPAISRPMPQVRVARSASGPKGKTAQTAPRRSAKEGKENRSIPQHSASRKTTTVSSKAPLGPSSTLTPVSMKVGPISPKSTARPPPCPAPKARDPGARKAVPPLKPEPSTSAAAAVRRRTSRRAQAGSASSARKVIRRVTNPDLRLSSSEEEGPAADVASMVDVREEDPIPVSDTLDLGSVVRADVGDGVISGERPLSGLFDHLTNLSMRPLLVGLSRKSPPKTKRLAGYLSRDRSASQSSTESTPVSSRPCSTRANSFESTKSGTDSATSVEDLPSDVLKVAEVRAEAKLEAMLDELKVVGDESLSSGTAVEDIDPDSDTSADEIDAPPNKAPTLELTLPSRGLVTPSRTPAPSKLRPPTSTATRLHQLRLKCSGIMPTKTLSVALDWLEAENYFSLTPPTRLVDPSLPYTNRNRVRSGSGSSFSSTSEDTEEGAGGEDAKGTVGTTKMRVPSTTMMSRRRMLLDQGYLARGRRTVPAPLSSDSDSDESSSLESEVVVTPTGDGGHPMPSLDPDTSGELELEVIEERWSPDFSFLTVDEDQLASLEDGEAVARSELCLL